jgi:hypothetical protein
MSQAEPSAWASSLAHVPADTADLLQLNGAADSLLTMVYSGRHGQPATAAAGLPLPDLQPSAPVSSPQGGTAVGAGCSAGAWAASPTAASSPSSSSDPGSGGSAHVKATRSARPSLRDGNRRSSIHMPVPSSTEPCSIAGAADADAATSAASAPASSTMPRPSHQRSSSQLLPQEQGLVASPSRAGVGTQPAAMLAAPASDSPAAKARRASLASLAQSMEGLDDATRALRSTLESSAVSSRLSGGSSAVELEVPLVRGFTTTQLVGAETACALLETVVQKSPGARAAGAHAGRSCWPRTLHLTPRTLHRTHISADGHAYGRGSNGGRRCPRGQQPRRQRVKQQWPQ